MPKTQELEREPLEKPHTDVETLDGVGPSSVDEAPPKPAALQKKPAEGRA